MAKKSSDEQIKLIADMLKKSGSPDEKLMAIKKALVKESGGKESSGGWSERAVEAARGEQGLRAKMKKYDEVLKKERLATKGLKSSYGEGLRAAGFGDLGDFIEKFFDKSSAEEQQAAKEELGIKDKPEKKAKKVSGGEVSSKKLEQRLSKINDLISMIRDDTAYIKDRISPKTIKAKMAGGKDNQTKDVLFDPLGPHGEQFRQLNDNGLVSNVNKDFQKSATMQASMIASKLVKEQNKYKDPKEAATFSDKSPLAAAMSARNASEPFAKLQKSFNEQFGIVNKKLDELKQLVQENGGGGGSVTDLVDNPKKSTWKKIGKGLKKFGRAASRFALGEGAMVAAGAAAVGAVAYGAYKMVTGSAQKEVTDSTAKSIEPYGLKLKFKVGQGNMPTDVKYELNGKDYKFADLPQEYQTIVLANSGGRDKASLDAQKEMADHSEKYKNILAAAATGKPVPVADTWDGLEKNLNNWLQKTYPDRNERKNVAGKYLDKLDAMKGKGRVPSLNEFLASAGYTPATPVEDMPEVGVTAQRPTPVEDVSSAPAAVPSTHAERMGEVSVPPPAPAPSAAASAPPSGGPAPTPVPAVTTPTSVPSDDKSTMDMVKKNEGYRLSPYKDSLGLWTVGVGHLIGNGKTLPPEWDRTFSEDEVNSLFAKDFVEHKDAAEKIPGFNSIDKGGQSALVDMTFNMGKSWWKKWPTFTKNMQNGDVQSAASSLENSKWYTQVKGRAVRNVALLRNSAEDSPDASSGDKSALTASLAAPVPSSASASRVASTGSVAPSATTNGAAVDTSSRQMESGKAAAARPDASTVVAQTSAPASGGNNKPTTPAKPNQAGTRSSDSSFNRALAKDFSHPTAFTTVGTV